MERISKRGLKVYSENPSIKQAVMETKTRKKRISNKNGNKFMIISQEGEIVAPMGFHEIIEVDSTQFVKLYSQGVKAFADLTRTATNVFEMIVHEMQQKINQDEIFLNAILAEEYGIKRLAFLRGMKELLCKEFIFESSKGLNLYYINVNYFFNGNRLGFLKEYRIKNTENITVQKRQLTEKIKNKNEVDPIKDQIKLFDKVW